MKERILPLLIIFPIKVLLYVFFAIDICNSYAQCSDNLFINGSFSSIKGVNVTAPGWIGFSTPDINNENGPLNTSTGYVWTGVPISSFNDSTWQNIFDDESVEQNVYLTPGIPYTLCFEYAAQGITYPQGSYYYVGPVGLNVYLDNVLTFTTPDDSTQFTWETTCYTFIPTTSQVNIRFRPTGEFYVGIDGACLTQSGVSANYEIPRAEIVIDGNPVSDILHISVNGYGTYEIIVFNINSKVVKHESFYSSINLNIAQLAIGIYFYEIRNKLGGYKKGKFLKM